MSQNTQIKLEFQADSQSLNASTLNELSVLIDELSTAQIVVPPVISSSKGDPITVAQVLVSIGAGTIPVLVQVLYDWYKTRMNRPLEVTVSKGNRSINLKISSQDQDQALKLIERLDKLLQEE